MQYIWLIYPESVCDKNLAIRKVFAFFDTESAWFVQDLPQTKRNDRTPIFSHSKLSNIRGVFCVFSKLASGLGVWPPSKPALTKNQPILTVVACNLNIGYTCFWFYNLTQPVSRLVPSQPWPGQNPTGCRFFFFSLPPSYRVEPPWTWSKMRLGRSPSSSWVMVALRWCVLNTKDAL